MWGFNRATVVPPKGDKDSLTGRGEQTSKVANVLLRRIESSDQGTFGKLSFNNFSCFTGELPDRNNESNISCIPKGKYLCSWTYSTRFRKKMYEVTNVPSRAGIRVHTANLMGDKTKGLRCQLNGCIALGSRLGEIDGQKALLLSRPAVRQFEDLMEGRTFMLEII